MAFNSILKALNRSLRNLYEMLFLTIVLRRKTVVSPHDYGLLSTKYLIYSSLFILFSTSQLTTHSCDRLPFFQESNTALGVVLKSYLTDARTEAALAQRFPTCSNPWADLQKGFAFWDQCVRLVRLETSHIAFTSSKVKQTKLSVHHTEH